MKRKLEENTPEGQNHIKLIKAISVGDVAEARQLIAEMSNEEIKVVDRYGQTALHKATFEGHKELCELLINKMSLEAISAKDNYGGMTAIHYAAFRGHKDVCELFISTNPEAVNFIDNYGKTALHYAAFGGSKELCELLILSMSHEEINALDNYGKSALHSAAEGEYKEVCKALIGSIYAKEVVVFLNKSNNVSPIQKAIGEIVADFIKDKFSSSEINPMNFNAYQIKLLKLYQVIDRDLLKSYLNQEKSISEVNNYITKYYFTLIGVCKSVSVESLISILVNSDCMSHVLSYLAPQSLCPEIFAPIELSGEGV